MKNLILIMYTAFVFFFLDGISLNGVFNGYTTLIIFYAAFLALLGITEMRKTKFRVVASMSTVTYIAIVILYFLELSRFGEEQLVCVRIIAFLTIAFINAYYASKYNLLNKFVVIFYMIAFGFVLSQFIEAGLPFEAYKNISKIFEQQRFRVEFGFYHINAAGNLGACMLILSGYIIKEIVMNMKKRIKKGFALAIVLIIDFIVLSYLLATGSRTAILSVILFCVIYGYYRFTTSKSLGGGWKTLLTVCRCSCNAVCYY